MEDSKNLEERLALRVWMNITSSPLSFVSCTQGGTILQVTATSTPTKKFKRNIDVYTLADEYDMSDLKEFILREFKTRESEGWLRYYELEENIHKSTPPADSRLRNISIRICKGAPYFMHSQAWEDFNG